MTLTAEVRTETRIQTNAVVYTGAVERLPVVLERLGNALLVDWLEEVAKRSNAKFEVEEEGSWPFSVY